MNTILFYDYQHKSGCAEMLPREATQDVMFAKGCNSGCCVYDSIYFNYSFMHLQSEDLSVKFKI